MSFTINTNIASLQAQDYLRGTTEMQAKTLNRVTSGLRIVSSGDDAAGLAIANGYRSDLAALTQGIRNVNDGLSQLQVMDGGINNISKLLDRARTLASQSASSMFTGDRGTLNNEFKGVLAEIDRQAQAIGLQSGGTFVKNLSVFVGGGRDATTGSTITTNAITNGTVSLDLSSAAVDSQSLGLKGYSVGGNAALSLSTVKADVTATFSLAGPGFASGANGPVAVTVNTANVNSLDDLVAAVNAGIASAAAGNTFGAAALKQANVSASVSGNTIALTSGSTAFAVISGGAAADHVFGTVNLSTSDKLATGTQTQTFDFAAMTLGTKQNLTISVADDQGLVSQVDVAYTATGAGDCAGLATAVNAKLQQSTNAYLRNMTAVTDGSGSNKISIVGNRSFTVTVGAPSVAAEGFNNGTAGSVAAGANGSAVTLDISNSAAAQTAITQLGSAINTLGAAQAKVGKGQNEFGYAVNLAQSQLTNVSAAESRIRDADLAVEAANMTKAQILLQAGVAAMAQANSAPQQVLTLLRG